MGIRESLLNTITSVSDSDFVRLVTSAGTSSKATVQNLFKSFESNLGAKSAITSSDYIRVVGSDNVSYKQPMSFFPTKAEVDASLIYRGVLSGDMDNYTEPGIYLIQGTIPTNGPSGFTWSPVVVIKANTTVKQIAVGSSAIATRNIGQGWYKYTGTAI